VEEMKNPNQMQQPVEKWLWLVHNARLWACIVNSKKQTLKGLKKIAHMIMVYAQAVKNESKR
jgi:hypothetical protein